MKKFLSLFLTLAMMFVITASPASAVEVDATAEGASAEMIADQVVEATATAEALVPLSVQGRYYPSSGSNSGSFTGSFSGKVIYDYLPSGWMNISYSISGATNTCYLKFYEGTNTTMNPVANVKVAGNGTAVTSVFLPSSGQYAVVLFNPQGDSSTTVIYAFNLYN